MAKTTISDKLTKVNDSLTVNLYDNGFMFEISGRDEDDDWASTKILCNDIEDVVTLIKEAASLPQS